MHAQPLGASAELFVQTMLLNPDGQATVRNCVSKYSKPHTFCDAINWIIYRIGNAIKSLFGYSDWQIAKKTIQTKALEMAKERGLIQQNPQDRIQETINKRVTELTDLVAESLLTHCLCAHNLNVEASEEMKKHADGLGLNKLMESTKATIDQFKLIRE